MKCGDGNKLVSIFFFFFNIYAINLSLCVRFQRIRWPTVKYIFLSDKQTFPSGRTMSTNCTIGDTHSNTKITLPHRLNAMIRQGTTSHFSLKLNVSCHKISAISIHNKTVIIPISPVSLGIRMPKKKRKEKKNPKR